MYLVTRDGFTLLAMGYTGEKAMRFKEAYIKLSTPVFSGLFYEGEYKDYNGKKNPK